MNSRHNLVIVDYGSGNLRSVLNAATNAAQGSAWNVVLSNAAQDIANADRIILPGQGAMADCMWHLRNSTLLEPLLCAAQTRPLLGICIGMQMLLQSSAEGDTPTLGLVAGEVKRFELDHQRQNDGNRYKTPQIGWNRVWRSNEQRHHPMWENISDGSYFYFVHSYFAQPVRTQDCAAYTEYGSRFVSAISKENLFAVQFHPEKSADNGIQLLRNFLTWQP